MYVWFQIHRPAVILLVLSVVLGVSGCDSESSDHDSTVLIDTVADIALDTTSNTDTTANPDVIADGSIVDENAADIPPAPEFIWIRGYTFAFAGLGKPVVNATIRVVEWPDLMVQSDALGIYELEVPNRGTFTPYVEHQDYKTMYLQTFTAAGVDLHNVNFQMVEPPIYDLLAMAVGTTPDPEKCQIATTVNTIDIRGMTLDEFKAYGPHGVAGAVAWSEPAVPITVYFNASVIPEPSLTETSGDGGVVWPNVAPGVYTFGVNHPEKPFASFVATCEAGRFINAGPPWGIRELSPDEAKGTER